MAKNFEIKILVPEKKIFSGEVSSLVVPAEFGYLGVLADHAPLIANLVSGKITYRDSQGREGVINNIARGFIEVGQNKVTILLDSVN